MLVKDDLKELLANPTGSTISLDEIMNFKIEIALGENEKISADEFRELALAYITNQDYTVEDDALDLIVEKIDRNRRYMSFANAKDLYSIIDQAIDNCKQRCEDELDEDDEEYGLIIYDDVVTVIA